MEGKIEEYSLQVKDKKRDKKAVEGAFVFQRDT